MSGSIRIGTRESRLAVLQSEMVADFLRKSSPEIEVSLVPMKTTGDMILDRALEAVGGKGLFVKELDRALLDGRSDISVHCVKDMPMDTPESLPILGFSRREDPRDVLVLPAGMTQWDRSKPVGCSSRRRILQLKRLYPEIKTELIRGNVQTRLKKLDDGQYGATILAAAGLKRLGLQDRISRYFAVDEMIPAAGQGILAIQGVQGRDYSCLAGFFDQEATYCALAERAFVRALNGGCSSPIAVYAQIDGETILLRGLYADPDGGNFQTGRISGPVCQAEELGLQLAKNIREMVT